MQRNDRVPLFRKEAVCTTHHEKTAKVLVHLLGFWSKYILHLAMLPNPFIR